jgi:SAM-dependent methyltransferase
MSSVAFLNIVRSSLNDGQFIQLNLRNYVGTDKELKNIDIKKVVIKSQPHLSFTYHYKTRDIIKNFELSVASGMIEKLIKSEFKQGLLFTADNDISWQNNKMTQNAPTKSLAQNKNHDKVKNRLIEAQRPFLQDLKITDEKGVVIPKAQDKFKQINRYVEIISDQLKKNDIKQVRTIADMGSGKGYLTFALYDYLTNNLNHDVSLVGVEYRKDMVDLCNDIAAKNNFKGLSFTQGSIEGYKSSQIDMIIALHACDTATDEAIAKGIQSNAAYIIVAPCCHKQIRREVETNNTSNNLDDVMRFGIFAERQCEMLTDSLRALIMEYHGYSTKVFEFISDAHTPKNIMIVAHKNKDAASTHDTALKKIEALKSFYGVKTHHLETLMKHS